MIFQYGLELVLIQQIYIGFDVILAITLKYRIVKEEFGNRGMYLLLHTDIGWFLRSVCHSNMTALKNGITD